MKTFAHIICAALFLMLGACATQTPAEIQANLQAQLTEFCPTATAEVSTLQLLSADLPADVNQKINDAAPIINAACTPGFIPTSTNMATFLPAITVIAVQFAANHK